MVLFKIISGQSFMQDFRLARLFLQPLDVAGCPMECNDLRWWKGRRPELIDESRRRHRQQKKTALEKTVPKAGQAKAAPQRPPGTKSRRSVQRPPNAGLPANYEQSLALEDGSPLAADASARAEPRFLTGGELAAAETEDDGDGDDQGEELPVGDEFAADWAGIAENNDGMALGSPSGAQ